MDPGLDDQLRLTRRQFFGLTSAGIGTAALATLMSDELRAAGAPGALQGLPHFAPTAKRVIYLFQSGGPAQMDLFDVHFKPCGPLARVELRQMQVHCERVFPRRRKGKGKGKGKQKTERQGPAARLAPIGRPGR